MARKVGKRVRADALLVAQGLAENPAQAQALIMAGRVHARNETWGEHRVEKAGDLLEQSLALRVNGPEHPYVSRGGLKLAAALDRFGFDPRDQVCADIGISTGGFSDCLLQRGAARIHAVDVGYGQTALKIRNDPRVRLYERTNARLLAAGAFGEPIGLMVIDVSFIGLRQILGALVPLLAPAARMVALVKPQFEAPRSHVGSGGIVRNPSHRQAALATAIEAARGAGLALLGQIESPIQGDKGNIEFLLGLAREDGSGDENRPIQHPSEPGG